MLYDKWSPALNTYKILQVLELMFDDLDSDCGINREAADLYIHNRSEFYRKAKEYTLKYAT